MKGDIAATMTRWLEDRASLTEVTLTVPPKCHHGRAGAPGPGTEAEADPRPGNRGSEAATVDEASVPEASTGAGRGAELLDPQVLAQQAYHLWQELETGLRDLARPRLLLQELLPLFRRAQAASLVVAWETAKVISRDEVDPDVLLPTWNASGTLSIKKGGSRTTAPSGPEQLRLRLTVLQNALLMIKLKHPGRAELADVTFAVFERYKGYLLGDYCYGLRSSEESGALVPPWTLVISYEHAIRKHTYKLMASDGRPFGEALAKAYKDATVKERHFTTPLALAQPSRPADATVECVDILRGAKMDLSRSKVRQGYLDRIKAGDFDAILLSPPCSSFSRATFANHRGPRPVRCYQSPRGMDTLTSRERDKAILGNVFADFAWEVATLVADGAASFLAFEQPEDLGTIAKGPRAGERPASMWQWPQLRQLLDKGLCTVAFHQKLPLAHLTLSPRDVCSARRLLRGPASLRQALWLRAVASPPLPVAGGRASSHGNDELPRPLLPDLVFKVCVFQNHDLEELPRPGDLVGKTDFHENHDSGEDGDKVLHDLSGLRRHGRDSSLGDWNSRKGPERGIKFRGGAPPSPPVWHYNRDDLRAYTTAGRGRFNNESVRAFCNRYHRVERALQSCGVDIAPMYDSEARGARLLERLRLSVEQQRLLLIGAGQSLHFDSIKEALQFPEHRSTLPVVYTREFDGGRGKGFGKYDRKGKGSHVYEQAQDFAEDAPDGLETTAKLSRTLSKATRATKTTSGGSTKRSDSVAPSSTTVVPNLRVRSGTAGKVTR
ncbi:unnamed protein product, partial [Symbiodinium microadriaticum]